MTAISEFELQVQEAANAGLFRVWPFRASSASAHWYLPDLIHFASKMQRLDAIFPYLEVLFSIGSAATLQPNHPWCLYESLCLLAEAHDLPITSKQTKLGISRLLGQWSIMRLPVNNVIGVWSTEPQPCRIEDDKREVVLWVVGALQANRTPCCDCSPSAAMQLVSVRSSEKPANPQVCYNAHLPTPLPLHECPFAHFALA